MKAWRLKQVSLSDLLIDIALSELPQRYNGASEYIPPANHLGDPCPGEIDSVKLIDSSRVDGGDRPNCS